MNFETMRTIKIHKFDARTKTGIKLLKEMDVELKDDMVKSTFEDLLETYPAKKYTVEIVNTYVQKTNATDPTQTFWERYDTPYYCSPSSETYWSM